MVGRAAWNAARSAGCRLWLWGLWTDLPAPSLLVPVAASRLDEAVHALEAHRGEISRTDYRRLLRSRAEVQGILGPELVFGFGGVVGEHRYSESLMEIGFVKEGAFLAAPRLIDFDNELADFVPYARVDWLGATPSPRRRILDSAPSRLTPHQRPPG